MDLCRSRVHGQKFVASVELSGVPDHALARHAAEKCDQHDLGPPARCPSRRLCAIPKDKIAMQRSPAIGRADQCIDGLVKVGIGHHHEIVLGSAQGLPA
jgi:hypothetical protein